MGTATIMTEAAMREHVLAHVTPVAGVERLRLRDSAGRVAAASVASPLRVPTVACATMDGFAARTGELPATLPIAGQASAGAPYTHAVPPCHCVAIATGAWVPAGLDIVIPIEDTTATDVAVRLPAAAGRLAYIRPAGSELQAGVTVLAPGELLTARKLALLASLGIDRVTVRRRPRVGVLATGDELRQPGETLDAGAIYDANRPLVAALLARHGCHAHDLRVARDDSDELRCALTQGMAACDALITIGGASVGTRDLLRETVAQLGTVHAWQVAIKPGKPFLLGQLGTTPLFGLPGNPASVFVTFICLVLPALWRLAGREPQPRLPWLQARAAEDLPKVPGRTDYQRGTLAAQGDGSWEVRLAGAQGSSALPVLDAADCLIRLPREAGDLAAGATVAALPLALLD